jgi:hypothetical protein
MRGPSKIAVIAVVVAAASALAGCGGGNEPAKPLSAHLDDSAIAAIAVEQQQQVQTAQNNWSAAKRESAKADADLADADTQVQVAHIDQQIAKLAVDAATISKQAAEKSADTNRITQTSKDLHNAEDLAKAADQRAKYLESYHDYIGVASRSAQDTMYWREAQYELAKSQLAQKNNIAPKGVNLDDFPKQEQERNERASSSKGAVDQARQRAMGARDEWMRSQETADRETGHQNTLFDPMAAKTGSATAGSQQ